MITACFLKCILDKEMASQRKQNFRKLLLKIETAGTNPYGQLQKPILHWKKEPEFLWLIKSYCRTEVWPMNDADRP